MSKILIIGSGIAALTCAKILKDHGHAITIYDPVSFTLPILTLNHLTANLICSLWDNKNCFGSARIIHNRKVITTNQSFETNLELLSVAIEGNLLRKRLRNFLSKSGRVIHKGNDVKQQVDKQIVDCLEDKKAKPFDWIIDASGRYCYTARLLGSPQRLSFGERRVYNQIVRLNPSVNKATCCMEITPDTWMFIVPFLKNKAIVQCMSPNLGKRPCNVFINSIDETNVIKNMIKNFEGSYSIYDAYPQISFPICKSGWIAVGDSATSFDPISGDGIGYSLKGSILAVAVINSVSAGLDFQDCLDHYTMRLQSEFAYHIKECIKYYEIWFSTPSWNYENMLMNKGLEDMLYEKKKFKFKLKDFQLIQLNE
jgi:flavin-dependent dehydrogenase